MAAAVGAAAISGNEQSLKMWPCLDIANTWGRMVEQENEFVPFDCTLGKGSKPQSL